VHRRYTERAVDPDLLRLLCACALSAPSKSDLQQADIVVVNKSDQATIAGLIPDQPFIRTAPAFLVFLANGRRLPEISKMRGKPFPTIISISSSTPPSTPGSCWRASSAPPTRSGSAPARSA
jgi:nitroreductase/FMN reductase [NAD(P)H]